MTVRESFRFGRHPNEYHATWEFEESRAGFSMRPMADGFMLTLNTNIEVSPPPASRTGGPKRFSRARAAQGDFLVKLAH